MIPALLISFTGSTESIEVILSRRGATIVGNVVDDAGRSAAAASVIVFAVDRTFWRVHYPITVLSSKSGAFRLGPFRRGEYFVGALAAGTAVPDPRDRDRFEQLAGVAERITLVEEEKRTIDLRVVSVK